MLAAEGLDALMTSGEDRSRSVSKLAAEIVICCDETV